MIEFAEKLHTKKAVEFLASCNDQVASTADIANHFDVSESCVRKTMFCLLRVNRVAEIHANLWHLE